MNIYLTRSFQTQPKTGQLLLLSQNCFNFCQTVWHHLATLCQAWILRKSARRCRSRSPWWVSSLGNLLRRRARTARSRGLRSSLGCSWRLVHHLPTLKMVVLMNSSTQTGTVSDFRRNQIKKLTMVLETCEVLISKVTRRKWKLIFSSSAFQLVFDSCGRRRYFGDGWSLSILFFFIYILFYILRFAFM